MRIILALLMCWGVAFGQDTTKYFKSVDYGWNWQRGKFRGGLILPTDTTNNKLGIAQIGATCFAWSGLKWNSIGSTDTSFLVRYYRKNQVDSAIAANYPALTLQDVTTNGKTTTDSIIAASFKRTGGTSSQFLKANGSVDNNTYLNKADSIAGGYYPYSSNPKGYLTSVTGYVPYTGATSDVDLGLFALNAASVKINGTNGNGNLHLRHQASDATATGQSTVLFANSNGDLKWKNDGNYYTTLQTYKNNANRVYTYQNKSYTLADSTTLADSVSALRTAVNTKGSGTVTSLTLGRGITGSSPITSIGTIGLDTTQSYTFTGLNSFTNNTINTNVATINLTRSASSGTSTNNGLRINSNFTATGTSTSIVNGINIANTASVIGGSGVYGINISGTTTISGSANTVAALVYTPTINDSSVNTIHRGIIISPSHTLTTSINNLSGFQYAGAFAAGSSTSDVNSANFFSASPTFASSIRNTSNVYMFSATPVFNNFNTIPNSGGFYFASTGTNSNTPIAFQNVNGNNLLNSTSGSTSIATSTTTDKLNIGGNLNLTTAGNKIKIATGTNASVGNSTLSSGTITVSTTAVTASSIIMLSLQSCSTCGTPYISAKTAGTSFVITSTNVLDASIVGWQIIN